MLNPVLDPIAESAVSPESTISMMHQASAASADAIGPRLVQNAAKNTKTVSNRRKISYIWGLPPLVTAERVL
jgi:hypothetical protein